MLTRKAYWMLHQAWFEAVKEGRDFTRVSFDIRGSLYAIRGRTVFNVDRSRERVVQRLAAL